MENIFYFLLVGFKVGFFVALPPGPMAVLCVRQTLVYGVLLGLFTGAGISSADFFYSLIIGYFASFVWPLIHTYSPWLHGLGGAFLLYLAIKIFWSKIDLNSSNTHTPRNKAASFLYTFILTLLSPMTSLLFISMFTHAQVLEKIQGSSEILSLGLGVAGGSMVWWCILAYTASSLNKKSNLQKFLQYINKGAGLLLFVYALLSISRMMSAFWTG